MTPYERKALKEIHAWQAQPPGWGTRVLAKPGGQVAKVVEVLVPTGALRAALSGADRLGRKLSDERSILKRAGIATLAELRHGPLEACLRPRLANDEQTIRVRKRQRTQEQRVNYAEDECVRADSEGQRQQGHQGEARTLP